MGRVDADQRQIPMCLVRVIRRHLLEQGADLVPSLRQSGLDGRMVGLDAGRQPKRCPGMVPDAACGVLRKGAATERAQERREKPEILLRIRIHPTRHGVGDECQHQHRDSRFDVGRRNGRHDGLSDFVDHCHGRSPFAAQNSNDRDYGLISAAGGVGYRCSASLSCFDAFSSREPVSISLENAIDRRRTVAADRRAMLSRCARPRPTSSRWCRSWRRPPARRLPWTQAPRCRH